MSYPAVASPPVAKARSLSALLRRCWRDLTGLGSVVAMALAYLSPAATDGGRFGSFDFVIPLTSLGKAAFTGTPFNHVNSDVVSQMNAWNFLDWTQIHAGHFPLWNELSLLGLPQFLNFESAVLSLPDLVSYAVPVQYAFLVAVLVKLVVAGSGAYLLGRVLGLRPLGASFAGISFMLSGAFANWLTWPLSDVVAWLGWIAAFAVLAYRRPNRFGYVAGLAASVAFCLYGGFPEANVFVAVALVVLLVAYVAASCARAAARRWGASRSAAGPARDGPSQGSFSIGSSARVLGGGVIGVLLALPLWWPGDQILELAHRKTEGAFPSLPARGLSLLVAQGYFGLPTGKNPFFLDGWNYYESVSYVGVVVLLLAAVAVARWWRHPTVFALTALCVVVVAVSWQLASFHPVQDFLNTVAAQVQWERFRSVLGLPLGLLAGLGLETMVRRWRSRTAFVAFSLATAAMGGIVAELASRSVAGAAASSVRNRSLIWPAALTGLCALCAVGWGVALVLDARRGPAAPVRRRSVRGGLALTAALVLSLASAGYLLFAGVGINSYSHSLYPVTPAVAQLQQYVGSDLVGLDDGNSTDAQRFSPVGFYPEVNLGYGIAEFAAHDPAIPQAYFSAVVPGTGLGGPGFFEPDIDTVALARLYGTPYVLALGSRPPLRGARLVADIAGERLYSVPHVERFTLSGGGTVSQVRHPSPNEYDLTTHAGPGAGLGAAASSGSAILTLRVSDVPGWHASIDGHPAQLLVSNGVMWSLAVPQGTHQIRIWYWPRRLSEGLVGAGLGAAALVCWGAIAWWSERRRRRPGPAHGPVRAGEDEVISGVRSDVFSIAGLLDETLAKQAEPGAQP